MTTTTLAEKYGVRLIAVPLLSNDGVITTAWSVKTPRLPHAPRQDFKTEYDARKAFGEEVLWCIQNNMK